MVDLQNNTTCAKYTQGTQNPILCMFSGHCSIPTKAVELLKRRLRQIKRWCRDVERNRWEWARQTWKWRVWASSVEAGLVSASSSWSSMVIIAGPSLPRPAGSSCRANTLEICAIINLPSCGMCIQTIKHRSSFRLIFTISPSSPVSHQSSDRNVCDAHDDHQSRWLDLSLDDQTCWSAAGHHDNQPVDSFPPICLAIR